MAGKKKHNPQRPGPLTIIRRTFWTVVVLAVILYATALAVSRTRGFRAYLTEQLSAAVGVPLTAEAARANWNLDLTITGVDTLDEEEERRREGIWIDEAHVTWSLAGWLRPGERALTGVELQGCTISFVPAPEGGWLPKGLSTLASWVASQLKVEVPQPQGPAKGGGGPQARGKVGGLRTAWKLLDAEAIWWDEAGNKAAHIREINAYATPVRLPVRRMTHYHLTAADMHSRSGFSGENLYMELIQTEEQLLVMGFRLDSRRAVAAPPVPRPSATDSEAEEVTAAAPARVPPAVPKSAPEKPPAYPTFEDVSDEDFAEFVRKSLEEALAE